MASLRGSALAILAGACAAAGPFPLQLLTDPKARCMDGTPGGYYLEPAARGANETKWIIYLQGGGECGNQPSCDARKDSSLGSSKYFSKSVYGVPYFAANDPATNPNFASWNHVYVPYCTSDLFSGTQTALNSLGYYFAGRLVVSAILDALESPGGGGLGSASEIILFGDSAGGLGTFINLDYVAGRFPRARVTGAPIAGYFAPAYFYKGPGAGPSLFSDFSIAGLRELWTNWSATADADCVKALAADPSGERAPGARWRVLAADCECAALPSTPLCTRLPRLEHLPPVHLIARLCH